MTKGHQDISKRHDLIASVRMIGGAELVAKAKHLSNADLANLIEGYFARVAA